VAVTHARRRAPEAAPPVARETAGTPTLLYFGYTSCPNECPTALTDVAAALRRTDADLRDGVKVVFVTTDPERDTAPVLRTWLDTYGEGIVGLTGPPDDVAAAQTALGIRAASRGELIPTVPGRPNEHAHKPETAPHTHDGPLGYCVDHRRVVRLRRRRPAAGALPRRHGSGRPGGRPAAAGCAARVSQVVDLVP
jgi:cytochrome oxidase Cu insertion factor (SCO1/SenC/PrrC family)